MTVAMLIAILFLYTCLRITYSVRAHNDPRFGMVLAAAALGRIAVAIFNHHYGPLPGARIDAVMFDETARNMALAASSPTQFLTEMVPLGYASLLSVFYMIAGHHYIIPTFVNLVFYVEFLILIYGLTRNLGGERAAQLTVLVAAFYPTSLIYTSVSLREAPLLWGLAVYVKALFGYYKGRTTLFNWKILGSLVFMVWLHDGFTLAVFLIPIAIWFRHHEIPAWRRLSYLLLTIAVVILIFGVSITIFDFRKLPPDPLKLLDAEWLARMRELKSAYGMGYGEVAPTWGGIIRSAPLMIYAFVAAPFPFWWEGEGDLPKMFEGLLSLVIVIGSILSVVAAARLPGAHQRKFLLAMYIYLVAVFAMGTGNTGIAARHRAKFIWMPVILNSIVIAGSKRHLEEQAAEAGLPPPPEQPATGEAISREKLDRC